MHLPPRSNLFPYTTLFRSSSTFGGKFRKGRLPLVRNQDEIPGPSEEPSGRQWYRDRHTLSQTYPSTSTLQAEVRICGRGVPAERVALKRGLELTNVPDPRRRRSGPGVRGSEEISSRLAPKLSKHVLSSKSAERSWSTSFSTERMRLLLRGTRSPHRRRRSTVRRTPIQSRLEYCR